MISAVLFVTELCWGAVCMSMLHLWKKTYVWVSNADTERSGYMGIGYEVIPARWLIFGWTRTKWAVIYYNISVIRDDIPDIWLIFEAVEAGFRGCRGRSYVISPRCLRGPRDSRNNYQF